MPAHTVLLLGYYDGHWLVPDDNRYSSNVLATTLTEVVTMDVDQCPMMIDNAWLQINGEKNGHWQILAVDADSDRMLAHNLVLGEVHYN